MGPIGFCICVKCGFRKPHQPGIPCREETCPKCDAKLIREGSMHHQKIIKKKGGD